MKERPILFSGPMVRALLDGSKTQTRRVVSEKHLRQIYTTGLGRAATWSKPMAYGQPGDRLWVRETWATHACFDRIPPRDLTRRSVHYQADGQITTGKIRPGMFMPRWASRITLEITAVRVDRLQAISEADGRTEGVAYDPGEGGTFHVPGLSCASDSAVGSFRLLWESINGPGSWDANPWVWVIGFKPELLR